MEDSRRDLLIELGRADRLADIVMSVSAMESAASAGVREVSDEEWYAEVTHGVPVFPEATETISTITMWGGSVVLALACSVRVLNAIQRRL